MQYHILACFPWPQVPVIVFGDSEQINDSDEIIDHILAMQTAAQRDNRSALVHLPHVATEGSSAAVSEQQWRLVMVYNERVGDGLYFLTQHSLAQGACNPSRVLVLHDPVCFA